MKTRVIELSDEVNLFELIKDLVNLTEHGHDTVKIDHDDIEGCECCGEDGVIGHTYRIKTIDLMSK